MTTSIKERDKSKAEAPLATPEKSEKKGRNVVALVLQIIVWQVVALLVVETALFVAGLGEEEIFGLDPDIGFRHMTNKRVTWRSEGFATSYLDKHGLRESNVTLAKPAGTYRVALLGDSLTESMQVPPEQGFASLIEKELSRKINAPVQILNFGTSGYSTAQEYLLLKKQVLSFKPDLVLVCYNTRDCFENWSAPDEVLTNVRPVALHLPGGKLVVDKGPVTLWMRSPRARFLKNVDFLRQHSRMWGLLSAAELDLSMHNEGYKRVLFFLTKPGKAIRQTTEEVSTWLKANLKPASGVTPVSSVATTTAVTQSATQSGGTPAVSPAATSTEAPTEAPTANPAVTSGVIAQATPNAISAATLPTTPVATPAAGAQVAPVVKVDAATPAASKTASTSTPLSPSQNYQQLIRRTLGSLMSEMKKDSASVGSKFAVVALPVRSALSIRKGMDQKFCDMDYNDELLMLNEVCSQYNIPVFDTQKPASKLSEQDKDYLFYLVHLTPRGHKFVASQLTPVIEPLLAGKERK